MKEYFAWLKSGITIRPCPVTFRTSIFEYLAKVIVNSRPTTGTVPLSYNAIDSTRTSVPFMKLAATEELCQGMLLWNSRGFRSSESLALHDSAHGFANTIMDKIWDLLSCIRNLILLQGATWSRDILPLDQRMLERHIQLNASDSLTWRRHVWPSIHISDRRCRSASKATSIFKGSHLLTVAGTGVKLSIYLTSPHLNSLTTSLQLWIFQANDKRISSIPLPPNSQTNVFKQNYITSGRQDSYQ